MPLHVLPSDQFNRVNLRHSAVAIVVPNPSHCCPTSSTEWDKIEWIERSKSLILKVVTKGREPYPHMCKAVDRGMVITDVSVREKRGGKSGDWKAEDVAG